ncbi:MAG: polysaccharide biosynthesis protein [Burkholderiaceae bacterium]|jgi:FlaA1/EpsC-like NDP-sugar epimerase|nr:polysaccharide biosynthesis protein [Burkholderiaceae bacterium]
MLKPPNGFWPRFMAGLARSVVSKSWLPDLLLTALAWIVAFWLRFNFDLPPDYRGQVWLTLPIALAGMALGLTLLRVPRQSWRYVSLADVRRIAVGVLLGELLTTAAVMGLRVEGFPRAVFPIAALLTLVLLMAARAAWRSLAERAGTQLPAGQPLLVLGTLDEADRALLTLKGVSGWRVAGIVSPLAADTGRSVRGVPVLGAAERLADMARELGVTAVLLAGPPGAPARREALLSSAGAGLNLLTLPAADEWLRTGSERAAASHGAAGSASSASGLRRIQLEDLLGREPVQLDMRGLAGLFSGRTVLVTGAGGSIGSELCRQVARFGVARLVCVDQSEYATYQLEQALRHEYPAMEAIYYTASVREIERLRAIASAYPPHVVLHAAAYKHVPLMETHNEIEALRTNVLGTLNAARIAGEAGAERFVLISTDKAVNPANIMGASKRLAELAVQAVAAEYSATRYVAVRFGNVLGSSGSVVPLFSTQIAAGGPVTVTHPDIVRYFMTIPEAAQLVLQAGLMGLSGQICVLDMGEPIRIVELARMLIRLSGKTEQEIPIAFTGLRPGEKLYEELLADDETTESTPHPKLRIAKVQLPRAGFLADIEPWIGHCGPAPDPQVLRLWLKTQIPEYQAERMQY